MTSPPVPFEDAKKPRLALWFWLVALVLTAQAVWPKYEPYTWLLGDGSFYVNINQTILQKGGLDQHGVHPASWYNLKLGWNQNLAEDWSNIALGREGKWYPKHNFLMPLVSTPFYALGGRTGVLVFNVLQLILLAWLAGRLAAHFAGDWAGAIAAMLMLSTTYWLKYAYNYSNDLFYTNLVIGGALAFFRGHLATGGVLLGLSFWCKITNALFLPPFALILLSKRDWRGFVRFTGAACLPVMGFACANWYQFGSPIVTSYQRILIVKDGNIAVGSAADLFKTPFKDGLKDIFTSGSGLFKTSPLAFVGLLGFVAFFRRNGRAAAGIFVMIAANVLLFVKYDFYEDRFLFPAFAFAVVPMACWFSAWSGAPGWLMRGFRAVFYAGETDAIRPLRVGVTAVVALIAALGVWWLPRLQAAPLDLHGQIDRAQVFLGDIPCDYFNNLRDGWECSHYDDPSEITGRHTFWQNKFSGEEKPVVWMHPQIGRSRRIMLNSVNFRQRLLFSAGLTDASSNSPVFVKLRVDGQEIATLSLDRAGQWQQLDLPTKSTKALHTIEVIAQSERTGGLQVGVNLRATGSPK